MSSELNRKFSSLRPVFKDLVIKKAALKWNTTVFNPQKKKHEAKLLVELSKIDLSLRKKF